MPKMIVTMFYQTLFRGFRSEDCSTKVNDWQKWRLRVPSDEKSSPRWAKKWSPNGSVPFQFLYKFKMCKNCQFWNWKTNGYNFKTSNLRRTLHAAYGSPFPLLRYNNKKKQKQKQKKTGLLLPDSTYSCNSHLIKFTNIINIKLHTMYVKEVELQQSYTFREVELQ